MARKKITEPLTPAQAGLLEVLIRLERRKRQRRAKAA